MDGMTKKFILTNNTKTIINPDDTKITIYQIKALIDFRDVKSGDLGGYVQFEKNLSQIGDSWIYNDACACDDSYLFGNAVMYNYSTICSNALVYGNAIMRDTSVIRGKSVVGGNVIVCGNANIDISGRIDGNVHISGYSNITGITYISGNIDEIGK